MKLIIQKNTFLACMYIFHFYTSAQNTTQEEYNYIKTGIQNQIDFGQDVQKRGYYIQNLGKITVSGGMHAFTFRTLYRDDKSIAGFWVQVRTSSSTQTTCIPLDTPELKQQYLEDIGKWDTALQRSYMQACSSVFSSKIAEMQATNNVLREKLYGND